MADDPQLLGFSYPVRYFRSVEAEGSKITIAFNAFVNDLNAILQSMGFSSGGGSPFGTMAYQQANAVAITGGTEAGVAHTGGSVSGAAITGGSINNTPIGATTPSTGAFTTLSTTGTATFGGSASFAGGLNSTPIGATTPSTGSFTTLAANATATLTGNNPQLVLQGPLGAPTTGNTIIQLVKPASGYTMAISGYTATVPNGIRWQIVPGDASAESGSDTGSNFAINAFSDTFTLKSPSALAISRATQAAVFGGDVTMPSQNGGQLAGFRNLIINGSFEIDQRNNFGAVSIPTPGAYVGDRWSFNATQAGKLSVTAGQTVGGVISGFNKCAVITVPSAVASLAAGDAFYMSQGIEGLNIGPLNWGTGLAATITVSFVAYSAVAGTYPVAVRNSANNRSYVTTFALAAATFTKITLTIPGDTAGTWTTDTTAGITLSIGFGVGTTFNAPAANAWQAGNYLSVAGCTNMLATTSGQMNIGVIQLEAGSVATPFERRNIATEMMLCQRYYQRYTGSASMIYINGYGAAGQGVSSTLLYSVMRTTPTISTIGTWSTANCSAPTLLSNGNGALLITTAVTALGAYNVANPANGGFELRADY